MNKNDILKIMFANPSMRIDRFKETYMPMIEEINATEPDLVLDLGCGANSYKSYIPNLIGMDILGIHEDITADISSLPFKDECADIILCMGSLNFGTFEDIHTQVSEIVRVLKPNGLIYVRALSGFTSEHGIFFDWQHQHINSLTDEFNLEKVTEPHIIMKNYDGIIREFLKRQPDRLFWTWRKKC